jgi:hypothetical protein
VVGKGPSQGQLSVGRENELHQFQRVFDAAASGNGGLIALVEPAIGRTALRRWFIVGWNPIIP